MIGRYGQINKLVPILAPQDLVATAAATNYVNLANAHRCTFLVYWGSLTSGSTTGPVVKIYASSAATTAGMTSIKFNYRKSAATGTDTWGAVTVATASLGIVGAITDDNMLLLCDIDPADIRAGPTNLNGVWAHAVITPGPTDATATLVSVVAEIEPRYAQTNMVSSS